MSAELKEQIARAIRAALHGGDENDVAEAVMAVLREQGPAATYIGNSAVLGHMFRVEDETLPRMSPLYAAPVPPAASAVPEGWQLVPTAESRHRGIYKMLAELHIADRTPGLSEWDSYRALLAVAPKPEGE